MCISLVIYCYCKRKLNFNVANSLKSNRIKTGADKHRHRKICVRLSLFLTRKYTILDDAKIIFEIVDQDSLQRSRADESQYDKNGSRGVWDLDSPPPHTHTFIPFCKKWCNSILHCCSSFKEMLLPGTLA